VTTRHPENDAVFIGTNRGLEARVVPQAGFVFEAITSRGLKGMGPLRLLLGILLLPLSFFESLRLLWRYRPDVVVGVGGYSSGPVVLTAWLMRIPTAVQEQYALPGLTNRVLGRFVKSVFLSFDSAVDFFPSSKCHVLGNPIRKQLMENFLRKAAAHPTFNLLVFGGSLGARGLNQRVLEALDHLAELKSRLTIVHQTGKADLETVRAAYAQKGFTADVREFIDDMSAAYANADLVICRAGATSIAELTCCKKASILVPFPLATDDHQAVNAQALVEAGAALMFREGELTGEKLAQAIGELAKDPARLAKMEKASGALGHPEAAREITEVLADLVRQRWGGLGRPRRGPRLTAPSGPTEVKS
jgi:UDP-N-acetylglucosamine--N-acetylmuramyl-(pentapeptide) pyrophosphoryl-undecaprenol N-acetylglucosamine transferase